MGLRAHDGTTAAPAPLVMIPAGQLPHLAASRDAVVVSANNLPYGSGYPLRLSPTYSPPYRASEIVRRLRRSAPYTVESFRAIQADTISLADRGLARLVVAALRRARAERDADLAPAFAALSAFDGTFASGSRGATVIQRVRGTAIAELVSMHLSPAVAGAYLQNGPGFVTLLRALRERPRGWFPQRSGCVPVAVVRSAVKRFGRDAIATPYGDAYAVRADTRSEPPASASGTVQR